MNAKRFAAVALLGFALVSTVTLVARQVQRDVSASQLAEDDTGNATGDGLVAYYFHGDVRCPTCRSIEAGTHDALQDRFAEELAEGVLRLSVVNYEQPEHAHFANQYDLVAPSVVLVRFAAGDEVWSKNLDRVWELVGDETQLKDYVAEETTAALALPSSDAALTEEPPQ